MYNYIVSFTTTPQVVKLILVEHNELNGKSLEISGCLFQDFFLLYIIFEGGKMVAVFWIE